MAMGAHWDLLPQDARKALAGLSLRPRLLAEGRVAGLHPSSHPGQSLEFSDLKGYAFGDDPKGIDWKVLARTDKVYVRRYMDETNLTALLLLDASASMDQPAGASKYRHASSMLAGLAYVLLQQGDEVGVAVIHERRTRFCPPRAVPSHLDETLGAMWGVVPSGRTVLAHRIDETLARMRKKGLIVVASDLLCNWEPVVGAMGGMASRGNTVVLLHVLSDAERTFPYLGSVVFRSMESGESALLDTRGLRKRYLDAMAAFVGRVRQACLDARVFYHRVEMSQAPHAGAADVIRTVSGSRSRRV